jgi:hypothetical protein
MDYDVVNHPDSRWRSSLMVVPIPRASDKGGSSAASSLSERKSARCGEFGPGFD